MTPTSPPRPRRARLGWRVTTALAALLMAVLAAAAPAGATEGTDPVAPGSTPTEPAPTSEPGPDGTPEVTTTSVLDGTAEADTSTSAPVAVTAPVPPPPDPVAPSGAARSTGTGSGAGGQTLTVTPDVGLDPAGTEVEVTGTGYTAAAGFDVALEGMYVALCVDKGPGAVPSPCVGGVDMSGTSGSSKWITNNPYDGVPPGSVAAVAPDGSFRVTLILAARDAFVDCLDLPDGQRCVVATRMDHRSSADRSQDVKVPVCWAGQAGCATDPIPPPDPADPADPGDEAPFSGYQLETEADPGRGPGSSGSAGTAATGGGLAATGPELRPLPWGLALLGLGLVLVLSARRLTRRPVPALPSPGGSPS